MQFPELSVKVFDTTFLMTKEMRHHYIYIYVYIYIYMGGRLYWLCFCLWKAKEMAKGENKKSCPFVPSLFGPGPYGPGPYGPPWALMGHALMGSALMGRVLVGSPLIGRALMGRALMGRALMGQALMGRALVGRALMAPPGPNFHFLPTGPWSKANNVSSTYL